MASFPHPIVHENFEAFSLGVKSLQGDLLWGGKVKGNSDIAGIGSIGNRCSFEVGRRLDRSGCRHCEIAADQGVKRSALHPTWLAGIVGIGTAAASRALANSNPDIATLRSLGDGPIMGLRVHIQDGRIDVNPWAICL